MATREYQNSITKQALTIKEGLALLGIGVLVWKQIKHILDSPPKV